MSRFPTPEALVSWAGLTPTARQSGPRPGRGKKGHGNTYAKRIAGNGAFHEGKVAGSEFAPGDMECVLEPGTGVAPSASPIAVS